ncbi:3-phosphoserine/phosphohydroxythreonine transaminase [Candidatus Haliotispira prima]|uniref:Phosphoserine aminotransferase n=1 Tax=Candidatus Haliotispira prima TaxID=3034016 RepID=A0ABY8MG53_9SPIO|nr:3-phosphoserine/phosphohydroxythreonine transaminase [Candidatus Haliotispira prima]
MKKQHNFSAGPAAIPHEVLQRAQAKLVDYEGYGLSLLELSHRGKIYEGVHSRCIRLLTEILQVPDTHRVLLLGGGATLQFGMVPMNLLHGNRRKAGIALSGAWAGKACEDLKLIAEDVHVVYDGKKQEYRSLPEMLDVPEEDVYLHLCSNETIHGVQWKHFPKVPCPIVADMSSDILSRPLEWDQFGIVYAGAQKNLGPAGLCLVVIREDLLAQCSTNIPAYLRYDIHAKNNSLYNTPPSFAVYMVMLQLEWVLERGGLSGIQQQNQTKADKLYQFIDSSDGFYSNPVERAVRSEMNVPFLLSDTNLEAAFLAEASERGMEGLKGHRSVGGMRASIYNAVKSESVDALLEFMAEFQAKNH